MDNGYKQSGIKMTQQLAHKTSWGLPELEARCRELTASALALWPYASTTYAAPEKQYDEYALDEGVSFTGLNLVKYRFRGVEHAVTTWAEMFCDVMTTLHRENTTVLNYLADANDDVDLAGYVGRSEDTFIKAIKIDDGLYVTTNTSTQSKINLLLKFFDQYREDPANLIFLTDDRQTDSGDLAERYVIRRKYWQAAIEPIQRATGSFMNSGKTVNNSISGATGRGGISILCVANFDSARVELYIDMGDWGKNKSYYDKLLTYRAAIDAAFSDPVTWSRSGETRASKIFVELKGVSVANESNWSAMTQFHAEKAKLMLDTIAPYLNL